MDDGTNKRKKLASEMTDRELLEESFTMIHSLHTKFFYLEKRVARVEQYERILGFSIGGMVLAVIVFQIIITLK